MPLEAALELDTEHAHPEIPPEEPIASWETEPDADIHTVAVEQSLEEIEERAEAIVNQWFGAEDFQTVTTYGAEIGPSHVEGFAWEVYANGQPLSEILDAVGRSFYAESVLPSLQATGVAGFPGRTEGGQVVDGSIMTLRDGKLWVEFCQRVEHRIEWDEEFPTLPPLEDTAAAPAESGEERAAEPAVYQLDAALLGATEQRTEHLFAPEALPEHGEAPEVTAARDLVRQAALRHPSRAPVAARAPQVAPERLLDRAQQAPEAFAATQNAQEPTDEQGTPLPARERPAPAPPERARISPSDAENELPAGSGLLETTDARASATALSLPRESAGGPALLQPESVVAANDGEHAPVEREASVVEPVSELRRSQETSSAPAAPETTAATRSLARAGGYPTRERIAKTSRIVATEAQAHSMPDAERRAADDRGRPERASVPWRRQVAPETTLRADVLVTDPRRADRAAPARERADPTVETDVAGAPETSPERGQDAPVPFERNEGGELPWARGGAAPLSAATPAAPASEFTPTGRRAAAP